jgi:hypothetical protein
MNRAAHQAAWAEAMMARFIKFALCLAAVSSTPLPLQAQNNLSDLPAAPDWPPYKWFASTDPKHKNHDYLLLKPGETRKFAVPGGNIERLWWTATEPEKIEFIGIQGDDFPRFNDKKFIHEKAYAQYAPLRGFKPFTYDGTQFVVEKIKAGS